MKKKKLKREIKELKSKLFVSDCLKQQYYKHLTIISENPNSSEAIQILEKVIFENAFQRDTEIAVFFGTPTCMKPSED